MRLWCLILINSSTEGMMNLGLPGTGAEAYMSIMDVLSVGSAKKGQQCQRMRLQTFNSEWAICVCVVLTLL